MGAKDRAEAAAFAIVPQILGARLEEYDHSGRQGVVDALLHMQDGSVAALEVTTCAAQGRRQLYALLDATSSLPNPGEWTWSATIDHPRDFPALRERLAAIILKSEALGITRPHHAMERAGAGDPDFDWLCGSSVELWGSSDLPKIRAEDGVERPLYITQGGSGGTVDEALDGFNAAVEELLKLDHVQGRLRKLQRAGYRGQHLFIVVDESALPFSIAYPLMRGSSKPPGKPSLPLNLTHLWLLVTFSPWILVGTVEGWQCLDRHSLESA